MTSYVAQVNTGADALVSSRSVSTPGGVASGDVGVFWLIRWNESASFPAVTPPSGAILRGTMLNGTNQTLCYLLRVSAETSFAFSWTGTRWSALAVDFFTGVDPALDLSAVPYQAASGAAAPVSTLTVTTTNTAALAWSVNTIASSSGITHTPPTNFTEDADVAPWSTAHYIATSDGSQSASGATFSPSQIWIAALVALAPASSGANVSGTDTGSGTEAQSLAVTLAATDTGTSSESQSLAQAKNDTGSGTENQTIATTLSVADSLAATESMVIQVSSSDGILGSESQALAVTASGADSGSSTDSGLIGLASSDAGSATDTATLAVSLSNGDTATSTLAQSTSATVTQNESMATTESGTPDANAEKSGTDSISTTENQIVYIVSSDGVTAVESENLAATVSQADSVLLHDMWVVHTSLSAADSMSTIEAEHVSEPFGLTALFSAPFSDTVLKFRLGSWQARLRTYTEDV